MLVVDTGKLNTLFILVFLLISLMESLIIKQLIFHKVNTIIVFIADSLIIL